VLSRHGFPGLRPDVHGPPFRRALAFLGFWVRRLLQTARRNRHRVSLLACQTESRRSKGQVSRAPGHVAGWIARLIVVLVRPGTTFFSLGATCWCAPKPCHGDVRIKLANRETAGTIDNHLK
jgi:hypothetical protein